MSQRNKLTYEDAVNLISESLKNRFVVMPNVPLSTDEARCYFEVTNATLRLNYALNESNNLQRVTDLIKVRNELLKEWQTKFGFKYPI